MKLTAYARYNSPSAALAVALALAMGPIAFVRADEGPLPATTAESTATAPVTAAKLDAPMPTAAADWGESVSRDRQQRLAFGGYGEIHANVVEGPGNDQIDLHRIVLSTRYDFTSWLTFQSEFEVEHAFVAPDGTGEVDIEQAYIEYTVCDWLHVRAGRMLVPLGIVNRRHEPTNFNGVERPEFDNYIIPSTWFADGVGIRGWLGPAVTYEAYVMSSLNGSKFNADGIRDSKLEQSSSLNQPAFSGRIDWFPFALAVSPDEETLRFGASSFLGGLNNGTAGVDPGINGNINIVSADFEYRYSRFDFRGEFAFEDIKGAEQIGNGTASEIVGGYWEAALHVLPDGWRCGRLQKADALIFVRYDDYNTQYRMPIGVAADPAFQRYEWTVGVGFLPVPNFVVKADYQLPHDETSNHLPARFNAGLGWQF